jgi:hypothetical protein
MQITLLNPLLFKSPKLAVIVVKKRSNARFFLRGRSDFQNAPMGTVIDNTVVKNKG